jgi:Tetratricopeptide repeat
MRCFFCCLVLILNVTAHSVFSKPYIPTDPNHIIAEWDAGLVNNKKPSSSVDLAWARLQQHEHHFDAAQEVLQKIINREPDNTSAILLAARIYMIQDKPQEAKAMCLRLLSQTDLLTLSTCSLEAQSLLGKKQLQDSFAQLKKIVDQQGLPQDGRKSWILQTLAAMASRLAKAEEALVFIGKITEPKTTSVWVQWADIHLSLKKYAIIVNQFSELIGQTPEIEDTLLLRLVIAEKKINDACSKNCIALKERVALREWRNDQAHAADIALYYLDVAWNPKKALYWAERNWQLVKEPADKELLARAQKGKKDV